MAKQLSEFMWIGSDGNTVSNTEATVKQYLSEVIPEYDRLPGWAKDTLISKVLSDKDQLQYVKFIMQGR